MNNITLRHDKEFYFNPGLVKFINVKKICFKIIRKILYEDVEIFNL